MRIDPKERQTPHVALRRDGQRLESWKAIANYLNRTVRTMQRWEKLEGLPVYRHDHGKQGRVFAYAEELDEWRLKHSSGPRATRNWPTRSVLAFSAVTAAAVLAATFWRNAATSIEDFPGGRERFTAAEAPVASPIAGLATDASPGAYQQFVVGRDHLNRRNYRQAIAAFERATSLDAGFARAHAALVLTSALQSGQVMDRVAYSAVRAEANEALRTNVELPEAHAALGVLALEEGRVNDAEVSLRAAIDLDPLLVEAQYWLTVALDEQGRHGEADDELYAGLAIDPLHPGLNDALATRYRARGEYEPARQRYLAMLELESPPISAFHGLLELSAEFGRMDQALYWAEQIALRKPVFNGLDALISSYSRLEMNTEADHWRERLADVEAGDAPRLGAHCKYLYMRGRIEECFALKDDYVARSGESVEQLPFAVQETYGGMAVLTGRYEEGIAVLEPLFRPELRVPEHLGGSEMAVSFAQILAYGYQQTGREAEARALIGEISTYLETLKTRNSGARPSLVIAEARNHALLGLRDQALAALREAVEAGWRDYVYERPHPAWISLEDDQGYQRILAFVRSDVANQRRELRLLGTDREFEAHVLEAIDLVGVPVEGRLPR